MKTNFGENLKLLLFVLLVFCLARAFNPSAPRSQVSVATQSAVFSNTSCSQPGCGYNPYFCVENLSQLPSQPSH